MGSPLGPRLANVFLCYHEKIWHQNCPSEFKPVIYIEGMSMIHSYFFTPTSHRKILKLSKSSTQKHQIHFSD